MKSKNALAVSLFVFIVAVYALSFSFLKSNRNIGEGYVKIAIMDNFLKTGSLGYPARIEHGVEGRGGKYYTWHEFGQNIFVIPFFAATRSMVSDAFAFYLVNMIFTALTCVLIMHTLLLLRYGLRASALTGLAYGLGTFAWFYGSKAPFEHPIAVFFVVSALYFGLRYTMGYGGRNLVFSSLSIGFGIITRTDVVLSIVPLAVLFFMGRRREPGSWGLKTFVKAMAGFFAALVPFFGFILSYNYIRFGSFLQSGQWKYWGTNPFSILHVPTGLAGLLVSPGKSLFLYSPILVLFPFYLRGFFRATPRHISYALLSLVAVYLLFYSFFRDWHGDWCWGPRYILVITPFLIMPLAALIERWHVTTRWKKALIICVLCITVVVQIVPLVSNFYVSLVMKYGIDDTRFPALKRSFGNDFATFSKTFFILKYAAVFNQFEVFTHTLRLFLLGDSYAPDLYAYIMRSETPQLWIIRASFNVDLWWLQKRSTVGYLVAGVMACVAVFSSLRLLRELKRTTQPLC
jgi:hypothetical protein